MMTKPKCPIIALEEHYWDAELAATYTGVEAGRTRRYLEALARSRRVADQGDGRGRHRHAGDLARRALGAEVHRPTTRCALTRRVNDRLHAAVTAHPTAVRRLRGAADLRSQGRGRRARAHRQARLQGRDDPRARQRRVPRRQALLADLRARRRRSTFRSTCIRRAAAPSR